jgi:hypothetical protein
MNSKPRQSKDVVHQGFVGVLDLLEDFLELLLSSLVVHHLDRSLPQEAVAQLQLVPSCLQAKPGSEKRNLV